jgi:primosomal protein N' (replication factor Y)
MDLASKRVGGGDARFAWVAVPVPGLDVLQYRIPESFDVPPVGARVLVPLGNRQLTGCVVRTDGQTALGSRLPASDSWPPESRKPKAETDIKDLIDVIDDDSFLPPDVVELAAWVADYYACGPGEAVATAMPPYAWIESERAVQITEAGRAAAGADWALVAHADERPNVDRDALALLHALDRGKPVPVRVLAQKLAREAGIAATATHALARSLERQGLVATSRALRGRFAAFKTARVASVTLAGIETLQQSASGLRERQRDALTILQASPLGLRVSALKDRGVAANTLTRLASRGLVVFRDERVERDPFNPVPASDEDGGAPRRPGVRASEPPNVEPLTSGLPPFDVAQGAPSGSRGADLRTSGLPEERELTAEQRHAFDRLAVLADARAFDVALVHGVTGSGKTELYLRLARRVVDSGRSVLIMVPEIALTPALSALVRSTFGDRVAVQHSGLSDGERHDQWHRIRRGEIQVVVGTRSAVFAPLASLGLVVVDEEHDGSYKQEESPRYHGRDVAIMRAKRENALVVLGSATPSMESYHRATTGRYQLVVLAHRVLDRPLSAVRIVNMRDEYAVNGPDAVFSETLRVAIEERLARQEQVLVLLNRRGFATAVFCRQCGNTIECPNCSISLTIHGRDLRRGRCHYCNYSAVVPKVCPSCAAPYLEQVGVGTEQLEDEAKRLFPAARVARLDRDVAARRGATASLLARFGNGEIDLLIGTQMIAKGHDFPRVTLVGVISADVGLGLPDFRASERTFQLLTQVVGRAGRGERPGEAVIQTLHPEHYSVRLACSQDYAAFFAEEIEFRRAMRYPPHLSLVNAVVRGTSFQAAMEDASDLVRVVREAADGKFRVLGPAPAPFVKLRGEHRAQFFIKGTHRTAMRKALQASIAARPELRRRVTIDVDPLTVL